MMNPTKKQRTQPPFSHYEHGIVNHYNNMSDLYYPNLAPCRVVVKGTGASSKPPVRLPADCLAAAQEGDLPAPYDFQIGTTH